MRYYAEHLKTDIETKNEEALTSDNKEVRRRAETLDKFECAYDKLTKPKNEEEKAPLIVDIELQDHERNECGAYVR